MLEINQYASGSRGNLYGVRGGKTSLMLECGLRFKTLQQAFNYKLSEVNACLVTHFHSDHTRSIKPVLKTGINCYMTKETAEGLKVQAKHRVHIIKPLHKFQVGTFSILPFPTKHDADGSVGFLMVAGSGEKLVFATDTHNLRYNFPQVDYYMVECNHDEKVMEDNVEKGLLHPALANRISKNHYSLRRLKAFLKRQDLTKTKEIMLLHLSKMNADPERFKQEVEALTGVPVYV